jgi:hypothetical protein
MHLSPEAGRNLVGALGFRLVSLVRQIFQSPNAYQVWLSQQHNRVAQEFISICKKEAQVHATKDEYLSSDGALVHKNSALSRSSIEMLKTQTSKVERPRVLTPSEFDKMLTPAIQVSKSMHYSGLQRLFNFLNPFDQHGEQDGDWLSQFRSSGQALKIEMNESLEAYYDLLQTPWSPIDQTAWISVGARLIQINDALIKLCQAAEELVLAGLAKEAGFNLSLLFALLKGLSSERAILAYLIAQPKLVPDVNTWHEAISRARTS